MKARGKFWEIMMGFYVQTIILEEFALKYKDMNVAAKAAIWFTMCSFLQKGISFITVPIFTRIMNTEQYGTYTIYLSWLQILTIITSLYMFNGVYDNALAKFNMDRKRVASSMIGMTITITTIIFALFLLTHSIWEKLVGLSFPYLIMMFAESYVTPSMMFWSGRQRFEYHYRSLVGVTLLKSLLNPIIGMICVIAMDGAAIARVFSIVAVEVFFCVPLMIVQFLDGKQFYNRYYWNYGIRLAIPILPHYLSSMVLNQGDRIIIDKIEGKSSVALYGLAYSVGMIIQIFVTAINSAVTPWLYKKIKERDIKNIRYNMGIMCVVIALLAIMLMLVSPELVLIFGSTKYERAAYVIPPVAASVFFIFLYGILSLPEFYFEKTQFLMFASIGAAIANIGLNIIFIRKYGFIAASYTTLFCYILYTIGHYIVSCNLLKKNNLDESIIETKLIFILVIILIAVTVVSSMMFPYKIGRYLVILFIFAIWLVNKNKLLSTVIQMRKK